MKNHELFTAEIPDFSLLLPLKNDSSNLQEIIPLLEEYLEEIIEDYLDFIDTDNYLFCMRAIHLLNWHKDGRAFEIVYEIYELLDEEDEVLSGTCSHYLINTTDKSHGEFLFKKWLEHFDDDTEFQQIAFEQLIESGFVNDEIIKTAKEMLSDPYIDCWLKGLIVEKLNDDSIQAEVKKRLHYIAPMVKYIESEKIDNEYDDDWTEVGSAWVEKNFNLGHGKILKKDDPLSDDNFLIAILGHSDERTIKMISDRYDRLYKNQDDSAYYLAEFKERSEILEREFLNKIPAELSDWLESPSASDYHKGEFLEIFRYVAKAKAEQEKKDKVGRNDPCPCNSGKKFKKCCWK